MSNHDEHKAAIFGRCGQCGEPPEIDRTNARPDGYAYQAQCSCTVTERYHDVEYALAEWRRRTSE